MGNACGCEGFDNKDDQKESNMFQNRNLIKDSRARHNPSFDHKRDQSADTRNKKEAPYKKDGSMGATYLDTDGPYKNNYVPGQTTNRTGGKATDRSMGRATDRSMG